MVSEELFGRGVAQPRTSQFHFSGDLDRDADPGIFRRILHFLLRFL